MKQLYANVAHKQQAQGSWNGSDVCLEKYVEYQNLGWSFRL